VAIGRISDLVILATAGFGRPSLEGRVGSRRSECVAERHVVHGSGGRQPESPVAATLATRSIGEKRRDFAARDPARALHMEKHMSYSGPERRIHRVLVTRNTEYHMRRDQCVAVRNRHTGGWVTRHIALSRRVAGTLVFQNGGVRPTLDLPEVGACICFDGEALVTSPLVAIERPERELVAGYPEPFATDSVSRVQPVMA
jgi:hypothetical protein